MAIIKLHKKIDWLKSTSLYAKTDNFFSHYIVGLFHKIDEHHIFLLGGGLAFSLFVCIVPFILIIFSVLGNILEVSSVKDQIISLIDRIIPYTGYASFVKTIISSRMEEVIAHKNLAGYLGVLGLLFAASGLFSSMRTVLNKLYKVSLKESVVIGN